MIFLLGAIRIKPLTRIDLFVIIGYLINYANREATPSGFTLVVQKFNS